MADGFFVYVHESQATGKCYIGQADDLERRLAEHNSSTHNLRKFTSRNKGPWRLVYRGVLPTRSEAMLRELPRAAQLVLQVAIEGLRSRGFI
ncbi:GIY-YIG nuclease family protein [Mucisphaera sp.]|uniref:GIY-YIG nuclease family protein n=1 Tax=Mucisphaera sp. TaxID=2913024 RepID=UPI003D0BE86C